MNTIIIKLLIRREREETEGKEPRGLKDRERSCGLFERSNEPPVAAGTERPGEREPFGGADTSPLPTTPRAGSRAAASKNMSSLVNVKIHDHVKNNKVDATVNLDDVVAKVKEDLVDLVKVQAKDQQLIFAGKIMKDTETFRDNKIVDGSTVHMVPKLAARQQSARPAPATTNATPAAANTTTPPPQQQQQGSRGQRLQQPVCRSRGHGRAERAKHAANAAAADAEPGDDGPNHELALVSVPREQPKHDAKYVSKQPADAANFEREP